MAIPHGSLFSQAGNWASEASPTLGCSIKISCDIMYICRYVSYVKLTA